MKPVDMQRLQGQWISELNLAYLHVRGTSAWPKILYLHGAGQKAVGTEVLLQDPVVQALQQQLPDCSLVCPVCPADVSGWPMLQLEALMQNLTPESMQGAWIPFGVSMGGRAAYQLAYDHAEWCRALVCLAAMPIPPLAPRLGALPVYLAHGRADELVPFSLVERMAAALPNGKLCDYAAGHGMTRLALAEPELWTWLKAHVCA